MDAEISLQVDGRATTVILDTRTTLLDTLRDRLGIYSPKKGCDHGQCGACTVLLNGRRINSCLVFAVAQDGASIVTAAGLASEGELHPVQQAFLDQDGFQCGYCTPGQICSAVGMLDEAARGDPSYVTGNRADGSPPGTAGGSPEGTTSGSRATQSPELPDDEIRERMSGNLCRCGAYVNIVAAIRQALEGDQVSGHTGRPATDSAISQPANGMNQPAGSGTGQIAGGESQSGMNRPSGETGQPG
ncbi:(2Fe-2S)-binding protein [Arthrobacter sulfonylureivorans]|uniref:(2Fe-2S)-binding protein n=1 Tax=Arthrobacter sulfonylureivorans TaxID=2486855 RepID=UPI003BAF6B0B